MTTQQSQNGEILTSAKESTEVKNATNSIELDGAISQTAADIAPGMQSVEVGSQIDTAIDSGNENVNEIASESAGEAITTKSASGSASVKSTSKTAAQIKHDLLQKMPQASKMQAQVEREIKSEIRWLKRRSFLIGLGFKTGSAFELNNIVKKIRELKTLLARLADATVEMLKALWLRFVHGVM